MTRPNAEALFAPRVRPWFESGTLADRFARRRQAVLDALRGGPGTCEQIATRVGSHKRTVYREIQALRDKGVPIKSAPGFGYLLMGETQ